ncbi:MAG: ubiquinol-cytochrome c reductase cytochrome c subunit [Actinomycetota bacterium]|jgi:ubiquinol-cytochrome c reductase cytochrome c subunit|nr:ubiquinol-cytochrome c reductase cytochrome c subunit [Actinomycetota bacterium]
MTPARVFGLALLVVLLAAPAAVSQESEPSGQDLFEESCASCHGIDGRGTEYGPSLQNSGAAAADFELRTGRMPLHDPDAQTVRKPPAFSNDEIDLIVAYVASLAPGPSDSAGEPIPEVDLSGVVLSDGQEIYTENCAACHGATANGGAAGAGALAPSLHLALPLDVAEATIIGPGEMPKFSFDEAERNAVVAYVRYLQTEDAPGGADIGGIGPVPEGFVAWLVGIGSLTVACWLIGSKVLGKGEG